MSPYDLLRGLLPTSLYNLLQKLRHISPYRIVRYFAWSAEGNPQQHVDECRRVLLPGEIAVHTTCLSNPIHGAPGDFWRFTPDGLSLLHRAWCEILDVGGWAISRCGMSSRTGSGSPVSPTRDGILCIGWP